MQVQTHEMDPRIARIHYHDYLERVRSNREARKAELDRLGKEAGKELGRVRIKKTRLEKEDEELLTAYRELSREKRIILLPEAMKKAGVYNGIGESHLPKLAIVKADATKCYFHGAVWHWCHVYANQAVFASVIDTCDWTRSNSISLPADIFPAETTDAGWRTDRRKEGGSQYLKYPVEATVPKVPPQLCPDDLSKYYILFEPKWEETPDPDPILLSRSSENVFVVVATWNMTPLEMSVLESR